MLGGQLHRKDPKQAQWTSEKLPVPPAKQHLIKHTGTKEAGLSIPICLHGLDTIIWVTAFQKGTKVFLHFLTEILLVFWSCILIMLPGIKFLY